MCTEQLAYLTVEAQRSQDWPSSRQRPGTYCKANSVSFSVRASRRDTQEEQV